MINPITARNAFDGGTKADDVPKIKIEIRDVWKEGGPDFHDHYFDITMGGNVFSIDNGKSYDTYEKRCHFKIYESHLRDELSKIFGENKTIIDRMYNNVLNDIRYLITSDAAYKVKFGPNDGALFIISIDFEQKLLRRSQRRRDVLDATSPLSGKSGLPHNKIQ